MNQHLAPIMNRRPLTAGRHNSRQRLPKPQTVSETPQNKQTPMRRDLIAAPCHPHITSTATIHLGDAPSSGSDTCRDTRIIPHRRGFSANANPLNAKTRERSGLDDFVTCYNPADRHQRQESERFKRYTYEDLIARDKVSLDLFWLRDESLEDIDNLPPPAVLAAEIAEDLLSALTEIQALTEALTASARDHQTPGLSVSYPLSTVRAAWVACGDPAKKAER